MVNYLHSDRVVLTLLRNSILLPGRDLSDASSSEGHMSWCEHDKSDEHHVVRMKICPDLARTGNRARSRLAKDMLHKCSGVLIYRALSDMSF